MTIKELETIMTKYGLIIRAIPEKEYSVFEPQHINKYPNGKIQFRFGREMLVVEETPLHAGKFIIESQRNSLTAVWFKKEKFYDSIEEAVADILANISDN